MRCSSFALALSALLCTSLASAQQTASTTVPNLVRYSGSLKSAPGMTPFSSATTGVTFAIYQQQEGGSPIWMETQTVTPDAGGNYSVLLGSTTATGLPADLFLQQEQRWLGIQVQGQAEEPRVLLVSVPYAFKAHEAETLAGRSISDFVLADGASSTPTGGNPGPSSPSGIDRLPIRRGAASDGPTNFSGSTTDQIVGVTQTSTGAGVSATAPNNAVVGTATANYGDALVGTATGSYGYGLYGVATGLGSIGVKGASTSTSGTGMRAIETAGSGATIGISSYVASPSGIAAVFNNAGGGAIISGQNNGAQQFLVDGSGNVNSSAGTYQIGGSSVLSIGSSADGNLFAGVGAGANNVSGQGTSNAFSGYQAGYSNTGGYSNTFSGYQAGYSNTFGHGNSFSGYQSGYSSALASQNTFSGFQAGYNNTGTSNTFFGYQAGFFNTTGTADVYIGYPGVAPGSESNTIRIGTLNQQSAAYIAGIYGSTSSSGIPVVINSTGHLGTQTSSLRFKEQVRDMGDSTSALMKLRPVTFLYKPEYNEGDRTLQYGLIAEEVAQVYPELVAYDNDGQPYTVRYQYIATMLLNEVQKQYHRAEAAAKVVQTQQQKIEELEQRLSRLESLMGAVKPTQATMPTVPSPDGAQ